MVDNPSFFIAEVRDHEGDPWKSGRVKLRVYGKHDNEQDIPDDDLPWALPLMPSTSASTNKVGTSPTGMLTGSRVFGVYLDDAQQYPVILGTFHRAGKLKDEEDNTGGKDDLDEKYGDIPNGAIDSKKSNTQAKKVNGQQKVDPKEKSKYNKKDYVAKDDAEDSIDKARKKHVKKTADLKTIAATSKDDNSNVLSKILQVDSQNEAGALPQAPKMIQQLLQVSNMTSMSGMGGIGGIGGMLGSLNGINGLSGMSIGSVLGLASNQLGLGEVMGMMSGMLGGIMSGGGGGGGGGQGGGAGMGAGGSGSTGPNGGTYGGAVTSDTTTETYTYYVPGNAYEVSATASDILNMLGGFTTESSEIASLSPQDKQALYQALLHLMNNVAPHPDVVTTVSANVSANSFYVKAPPYNGIKHVTTVNGTDLLQINYEVPVQAATLPGYLVGYGDVPDGYVEVFSYLEEDPYPGYIMWEGPNGEILFTPRPANKPYTQTPSQDAVNAGIDLLLNDLTSLIKIRKLTLTEMVGLIENTRQVVDNQGNQNALGLNMNPQNQGGGGGGGMNGMMQQLLGLLGQLIQMAQQNHIMESVLDQGKMNDALQNYQKKGLELRKKKQLAKQAVSSKNENSGLNNSNGLLGFGNLQGMMGQLGSGGGSGKSGSGGGQPGQGGTGVTTFTATNTSVVGTNNAISTSGVAGVSNTIVVGYYTVLGNTQITV